MKVRVCDIRGAGTAGLPVRFEPGPQWYAEALAGVDADTSAGRIAGDLRLLQQETGILLSGRVDAALDLHCVRCLRAVPQRPALDLDWLLLPKSGITEGGAGGRRAPARRETPDLLDDDAEVSFFSGDTIDVGDLVREALLLWLPTYPVCREDCRGLCGRCGADLNEGPCSCPAEAAGSPFEALRGLKGQAGR